MLPPRGVVSQKNGAVRIVATVGSLGECVERNFGKRSPLEKILVIFSEKFLKLFDKKSCVFANCLINLLLEICRFVSARALRARNFLKSARVEWIRGSRVEGRQGEKIYHLTSCGKPRKGIGRHSMRTDFSPSTAASAPVVWPTSRVYLSCAYTALCGFSVGRRVYAPYILFRIVR